MMKKITGLFCAFFSVATSHAFGACEYKEASIKELVQQLGSGSDRSDTKEKAPKDAMWLIDINGVGLYYCLAHRADTCTDKSALHYLHANEVEYIMFGGPRMHVTKILDQVKDQEITNELLRAKTPDSYHRTVRKIAWKMKGLGTKTPYPVIRIKPKKRRSSHSKSC